MKLSAVEKNRPAIGDFLIAAVVIAVALGMIVISPSGKSDELLCTVTVDGELLNEYRLSDIDGTKTVTIDDCPYPVVLELEKNKVRVIESDCPNGDCVVASWADSSGEQIICLPNKMIISVIGGTNDSKIDAVTGG